MQGSAASFHLARGGGVVPEGLFTMICQDFQACTQLSVSPWICTRSGVVNALKHLRAGTNGLAL